MIIELEDKNAQELLTYLLNLKKRAEFVVEKKEKYPIGAVQRAEKVINIISPLINQLSQKPETLEKKVETLEKKLKDLEIWKEQTQIVLKKLVTYHEGV